jgi:hypothetical protein
VKCVTLIRFYTVIVPRNREGNNDEIYFCRFYMEKKFLYESDERCGPWASCLVLLPFFTVCMVQWLEQRRKDLMIPVSLVQNRLWDMGAGVTERSDSIRILTPGLFFYLEM